MERDNNRETTEMLFRDEQARILWNNILTNINKQSEIEREGVVYAIQWVKSMEPLVNNGETVESAAEKTYYILDDVSGFTLSLVFCILCRVWEYGEQLSYWVKSRKTICNPVLS